ncbi:hypothetical protein CONPUDRAFT_28541, partial [Coniophora puteana RWD-64-598 SS2]
LFYYSDLMRKSMLIPSINRPGHFMGTDLNIEHIINALKFYYSSKGIHASWDQLLVYAINLPIYRPIKLKIAKWYGASWGGMNHTVPDTSSHVRRLMDKAYDLRLAE